MPFQKERVLALLSVVLGMLSFLMLMPGLAWWAGLACALVAVILGKRSLRQPSRFSQAAGVLASILAVLGAGAFIFTVLLH